MSQIQVRARTSPFEIVTANLSDLISLPDPDAAEALSTRMAALDKIHEIHERSYAERGIIAREFERRELWRHLVDPDTREIFPNLTAWLSCSSFLGGRRTNFESKGDIKDLERDIPTHKLIDIPKESIKVLRVLSTATRQDDAVLEAARTMKPEKFLEKIELEHPSQHLEIRRVLRFSPGRSGAKVVEEMIAWALEHDIAGGRDEALVRACEEALNQWKLEHELSEMPIETAAQ